MSRLFDFSLALTLPTSQLFVAAVVLLFLTCLCAYFLYHRDQEARRSVDLAKNWGKQVEDEAKELQRTKMRIVVTYSVTLVLGLFLTVRVCVELLRRI